MKWENLIFLPFVGFIQWPLAALVPAAVLGAAYLARRRRLALVTALLWLGYAIYESLMKARVLCSGECNIRVDLLLISPALWILTIASIVQLLRRRRDGAA
ncbi:MAG TPA: hypothetical protein VNU64_24230 [Burkholderiales bacterium]|nr:hypothetical protein [Burkholderiales bacterium]